MNVSLRQNDIQVIPFQNYSIAFNNAITGFIDGSITFNYELTIVNASIPSNNGSNTIDIELTYTGNGNGDGDGNEWIIVGPVEFFTLSDTIDVLLSSSLVVSTGRNIDRFSITPLSAAALLCLSGDSLVFTKNIITNEISYVKAKYLIAGTHYVYETTLEKFVPLIHNVITGKTRRYMLIKRDLLGENKPFEDFLVTSGHRIKLNGAEIKARRVPGAKRIKVKPDRVYTFVIDTRGPLLINGIEVMAHGIKDFEEYAQQRNLDWSESIQYPDSDSDIVQETSTKSDSTVWSTLESIFRWIGRNIFLFVMLMLCIDFF